MKFNRTHWSVPVILVFCVTALAQAHLPGGSSNYKTNSFATVAARESVNTQANLQLIEVLESGKEVTGSIPGSTVANNCVLGGKQYKIEIVGGDKMLRVIMDGGLSVDLYVRHGAPVAIEDGKIVSDFKSTSSVPRGFIRIPSSGGEPVKEGSYFIAISNCATAASDYTLTADISGPPDVAVLDLHTIPTVATGSIPTPVPGNCEISRTQYRLFDSFNFCGFINLEVTIRADQNVNVVFRRNKPVAFENGVLMYDDMSENQVKVHHISEFQKTPGTGTFFIAILNCGFEPVNYTVTPHFSAFDPAPFFINNVSLKKKKLHVTGAGIRGAMVLIDGQPQKTIDGGQDENFFDILIVKNAKKKLPRNQTVIITALLTDPPNPCSSGLTNGFAFTRR